ncbi:hypothetical protein FSOLCH5_010267 [Fusarium solani]|jgi:hypothetical protein
MHAPLNYASDRLSYNLNTELWLLIIPQRSSAFVTSHLSPGLNPLHASGKGRSPRWTKDTTVKHLREISLMKSASGNGPHDRCRCNGRKGAASPMILALWSPLPRFWALVVGLANGLPMAPLTRDSLRDLPPVRLRIASRNMSPCASGCSS